ncbi:hypothetical protein Tco_0236127 [Tanacetum coccineum]
MLTIHRTMHLGASLTLYSASLTVECLVIEIDENLQGFGHSLFDFLGSHCCLPLMRTCTCHHRVAVVPGQTWSIEGSPDPLVPKWVDLSPLKLMRVWLVKTFMLCRMDPHIVRMMIQHHLWN